MGRVRVSVVSGQSDSPCWVWQGCLNSKGYGVRGVNGKRVLAHRAAFEERYGELDSGLHVHHVCQEKRCINPDHLRAADPVSHAREHLPCPPALVFLSSLFTEPRSYTREEVEAAGVEHGYTRGAISMALSRGVAGGYLERVAVGLYEDVALWAA